VHEERGDRCAHETKERRALSPSGRIFTSVKLPIAIAVRLPASAIKRVIKSYG